MNIRSRQELKNAARLSLSQSACSPKKLALLHAAVSAAVLLLGVLVTHGLDNLSKNTGGLSGMGLRAFLSTADTTFSLVSSLFLSFWELGIVFACLKIRRNEETGIPDLTQGLRRFGPLLRVDLLEGLIYSAVLFFAIQLASAAFILLPGSADLAVMFEEYAVAETVDESMIYAIFQKALPLYAFVAVISIGLITPIAYRLRMAMYLILDGKTNRATEAIGKSFAMMQKNCWALWKVDLSFWWYYALGFVLAVISSGVRLLGLLQIPLPLSGITASLLCYSLYLAGLMLLAWSAGAYVHTTYAAAYDALLQQAEEAAKAAAIAPPENDEQWTTEN